MSKIKIAGIIKESIVDGPGIRLVVFTQGCIHNCKNCHNPETHSLDKGNYIEIREIISMVEKNPILDGITISGGEPFLQAEELMDLSKRIKKLKLNIIIYTGYIFEDIIEKSKKDKVYEDILKEVDIIVDGPYIEEKKNLLLKFRGSENQRIIDVKKSLKENKIMEIEI